MQSSSSSSRELLRNNQLDINNLFYSQVNILEEVQRLVESGTSVNVKDKNDTTLLHVAVERNNLPVFNYLLSRDEIDVNVCNLEVETPLMFSVSNENLNMAKRLINRGADVNLFQPDSFNSQPLLHLAANQPEMCRLLIDNGADINATDIHGFSALHYAVSEDCLECVCMLLYFNADANISNEYNETPFHWSLEQEKPEMQRVLLDYVVDFNAETSFGMSILELAINHKSPFVYDIIERGADLNSVDSQNVFWTILRQKPVNLQIIVNVWSQFKGTVDMTDIFDYLENGDQEKLIDSIIEGENFELVVNSFTKYNDLAQFICKFSWNNLKLDQLTKLICRLLAEGYQLTANDVNKVYSNYGYCELFKIFLYTSSEKCSWDRWLLVPRLIFYFRSDINEVMKMKIKMKKDEIKQAFQYTANPALINYYLDKYGEEVSAKVLNLPEMPSLLELVRNEVRKHVADVFNCQTTCQFYTRINYLEIPNYYKEILTFESKLYKF